MQPVLGSQWIGGVATPVVTTPPVNGGGGQLGVGAGYGHVRVDSARDEVVPETDLERAVVRTKGWLEKRKRGEVERLVSTRNTDLRAGDEWLVYVSPAVKKRMGVKLW
jgi:hypothetical protein